MKILALDTTAKTMRVGVFDQTTPLVLTAVRGKTPHASRLAPLVANSLREANLLATDVDGIALTIGPGSYTGIRLGVAFAKGFAFAGVKPVWGFNTLEVMLEPYRQALVNVVAVLDARGGRLFAAATSAGEMWFQPMQIMANELAPLLVSKVLSNNLPLVLVGDGASVLDQALAQHSVHATVQVGAEGALSLEALVGMALAKADASKSALDLAFELQPWYGALTQPERLQKTK